MNNIKDGVCINHFPTFGICNRDTFRNPELLDKVSSNIHTEKLEAIESALEEYCLFAYNKSAKDIERVAKSKHNFKLKGFEMIVCKQGVVGAYCDTTSYVDNGKVFLVVEDSGTWYKIIKCWEDEMDD